MSSTKWSGGLASLVGGGEENSLCNYSSPLPPPPPRCQFSQQLIIIRLYSKPILTFTIIRLLIATFLVSKS